MTVWIYVDTSKRAGEADHVKVFATPELADEWFKHNDPEGVAFRYEVEGQPEGARKIVAPRDWHEEEDLRTNKRSWRRSIIAAIIICAILYLWLTTR